MKAAQKDPSGVFDSVLVHFGSGKARYHPMHLKVHRSMITVPSAWAFKPLSQVLVKVEVPSRNGKNRLINCHAVVVACRPLKGKGHYLVDLYITDLPESHTQTLQKIGRHSHSHAHAHA
jgi:hypothetical protein